MQQTRKFTNDKLGQTHFAFKTTLNVLDWFVTFNCSKLLLKNLQYYSKLLLPQNIIERLFIRV